MFQKYDATFRSPDGWSVFFKRRNEYAGGGYDVEVRKPNGITHYYDSRTADAQTAAVFQRKAISEKAEYAFGRDGS